MTALAMSSALRHCNDSKGALGQRAPQKVPHEIPPLLPIHNEVRQCHWGMSRRHKQAGNTKSIKNLTKDVSGADNSSIAVNNLTAGTVILPGQALPSLSGIPTGNPCHLQENTSPCAGTSVCHTFWAMKKSQPAKWQS